MLTLNQVLHLGASGKNPIITSEAQSDLWLERPGSVGMELFVMPAPPSSPPAITQQGASLCSKTPSPLKCASLQTGEIKQDLKAMHFLPGNLIWIDCSGFQLSVNVQDNYHRVLPEITGLCSK